MTLKQFFTTYPDGHVSVDFFGNDYYSVAVRSPGGCIGRAQETSFAAALHVAVYRHEQARKNEGYDLRLRCAKQVKK